MSHRKSIIIRGLIGLVFLFGGFSSTVFCSSDGHGTQFQLKQGRSTLSLSGYVNFLLLHAYDGDKNKTFVATNSNSNSRININTAFKPEAYPQITVGTHMQWGFPLNPSETVNQVTGQEDFAIDTRIMEFYLEHSCWGTLVLGKGITASDDISEIDYSKTDVVGYSYMSDIGGGLNFRGSNNTLAGNPTVLDLYNNLDGFGRQVRIQYNSPSFYGLTLMTSFSGRDQADLVFMYKNTYKGTKLGAALALTTTDNYFSDANEIRGNAVNGSLSVLFSQGTNMTVAGGYLNSNTLGRKSPFFGYVKLGQQAHFFECGQTAMSVDYGQYHHMYFDVIGRGYGVQLVQSVRGLNSEFYMGYRHYDPSGPYQNINVALAGLRYFL